MCDPFRLYTYSMMEYSERRLMAKEDVDILVYRVQIDGQRTDYVEALPMPPSTVPTQPREPATGDESDDPSCPPPQEDAPLRLVATIDCSDTAKRDTSEKAATRGLTPEQPSCRPPIVIADLQPLPTWAPKQPSEPPPKRMRRFAVLKQPSCPPQIAKATALPIGSMVRAKPWILSEPRGTTPRLHMRTSPPRTKPIYAGAKPKRKAIGAM
jgi:hypothetical protein